MNTDNNQLVKEKPPTQKDIWLSFFKRYYPIIILIVGIGLVAVFVYAKKDTITKIADSYEGWQTYRNEEYGFEFEYPGDWNYKEEIPQPSKDWTSNFGIRINFYNSKNKGVLTVKNPIPEIGYEAWRFAKTEKIKIQASEKYFTKHILEPIEADFNHIILVSWNDKNWKKSGQISLGYEDKNDPNIEILDQILSTFKFIEKEISKIEVISPNGGEKWEIGNTYDIKWEVLGLEKENVTLSLAFPEHAFKVLKTLPASLKKYSWKIPSDISPGNYKILITWPVGARLSQVKISDDSDGYFNIVKTDEITAKSIPVLKPSTMQVSKVKALVNGRPILRDDFQKLLAQRKDGQRVQLEWLKEFSPEERKLREQLMAPNEQSHYLLYRSAKAMLLEGSLLEMAVLDELIADELLMQEAERRGLALSDQQFFQIFSKDPIGEEFAKIFDSVGVCEKCGSASMDEVVGFFMGLSFVKKSEDLKELFKLLELSEKTSELARFKEGIRRYLSIKDLLAYKSEPVTVDGEKVRGGPFTAMKITGGIGESAAEVNAFLVALYRDSVIETR